MRRSAPPPPQQAHGPVQVRLVQRPPCAPASRSGLRRAGRTGSDVSVFCSCPSAGWRADPPRRGGWASGRPPCLSRPPDRPACCTPAETRAADPDDLTVTSSQGTLRHPMMRSRAPTSGRQAMVARHSWPMSMFRVPAGGPRRRRAGVRTAISPADREEHPRVMQRPGTPGSLRGTSALGRRGPRRTPAHAGPCARPGRPSPAPSGRRRAAQTGMGWRSTAPWT